ncbi:MAG: mRNA-degrading endonuclease [Desulfovibrionaceae bacterium]|nr:MAG: mRNA-degrading endonuclease [Desulfovibrionaceae bacterium]
MVTHTSPVPDQGAYGFLCVDETKGHEQSGKRPVFVISKKLVNARTGMMTCLPITTQSKGYSQEVILPGGLQITGALLLAHVRSFDFNARNFQVLGYAPEDFTADVVSRFCAMLGR